MDENPQLTREQAEACLKIAQDWVGLRAGTGWSDEMKLYPPGFHCDGWAIALAGGPEEWPYVIFDRGGDIWPEGVFIEPGASWYLGLYPTQDKET